MQPIGVVIFVVSYLLISVRRLSWLGFDRPAGALLGAVACVAFGVLLPKEALSAIDGDTILLLFGVMGMGAFLAVHGLFDRLEQRLLRYAKTPKRLLAILVWGSGIFAAFVTNDAVCALGAPVLVRLIQKHKLPPLPFLLALATGANTGSVATLVGNPQNMLCGSLGSLTYFDHFVLLAPVAAMGLCVNHLILWWLFRRQLAEPIMLEVEAKPAAFDWRDGVTFFIVAGTAVVYALGASLPWTATGGFVLLMLVHRPDTRRLWSHIDWALLLFFSGLFVVVAGLTKSGAPEYFFAKFPLASGRETGDWLRLAATFLIGSNVVSNVPFIVVIRDQMANIADPKMGWELLAMASTFAGNLTLLGSVANIIVAEEARDLGGIGFFEHFRVGFPLALLTTLLGVAWMTFVM